MHQLNCLANLELSLSKIQIEWWRFEVTVTKLAGGAFRPPKTFSTPSGYPYPRSESYPQRFPESLAAVMRVAKFERSYWFAPAPTVAPWNFFSSTASSTVTANATAISARSSYSCASRSSALGYSILLYWHYSALVTSLPSLPSSAHHFHTITVVNSFSC